MTRWIVETRLANVPGLPRDPWKRYGRLLPSRQLARVHARILRRGGYLTRMRPWDPARDGGLVAVQW